MVSNGIALDYLISQFNKEMDSYISFSLAISLVIILLGDAMIIAICLFAWSPYVQNLNNNIWRTKGMLSMIPIEVVLSNNKLKAAIISPELMKAVK